MKKQKLIAIICMLLAIICFIFSIILSLKGYERQSGIFLIAYVVFIALGLLINTIGGKNEKSKKKT